MHDPAWKETKNACLLTMSNETSPDDPHPEMPACFTNCTYVEQLVREMHATKTSSRQTSGETRRIRELRTTRATRMGAYTHASPTYINGFPAATVLHINR